MPGSDIVNANLTAWVFNAAGLAEKAMYDFSQKCQDWAQTSHRWEDQTGQATEQLHGDSFTEGSTIWAYLAQDAGGGDHGYWLETRTYSIKGYLGVLDDAILQNLPGLMADLRALFLGAGSPSVAIMTGIG